MHSMNASYPDLMICWRKWSPFTRMYIPSAPAKTCIRNFRRHFERHLLREKQELFPAIRRLDSAAPQVPSVTSITHLINSLKQDHDAANMELNRIRELTHGFVAPSDACQTYHAMLDGLWDLEMNMHQNVYEEDEFLFPRAVRREAMTSDQHGKT